MGGKKSIKALIGMPNEFVQFSESLSFLSLLVQFSAHTEASIISAL